ncbi:MAG TPA: arginase [Burkholderiales bacterium]|nr:arginase [Burkholderiales bacterium]
MRRQVEVIGAAWGLGGADPGCEHAPSALAPLLREDLERRGVHALEGPMVSAAAGARAGERRRQALVGKLCGELASAVATSVRNGRLPCVLGGDHSCAGGTWSGVARALQGRLGLVWIDAHMDSHTRGTSHTGRLHGMPLAWLLGEDDDPRYGLTSGVIDPAHVCLVGVRSYEPEEAARLARLGVRVIMMEEAERRGLATVLDEALAIAGAGTEAFGLSIDLDAVRPDQAPAVGTPVAGGLDARALARALEPLGARRGLAAVELVEYSPRRDSDGATARVAVALLRAALCGPGDDADVVAHPVERPQA